MLLHDIRAHMHEQNLCIMLIGGDDSTKVKEYERKPLVMIVSLFLSVHEGRKEMIWI